MSWVAVVLTPVVLLYQGWTYWVLRKRLTASALPDPIGLSLRRSARPAAPAAADDGAARP